MTTNNETPSAAMMERLDLGGDGSGSNENSSTDAVDNNVANQSDESIMELSNDVDNHKNLASGDPTSDDDMPDLTTGYKDKVDQSDDASVSSTTSEEERDNNATSSSRSPEEASELLVTATSLKEEGNNHFKAGDYDKAARSYRRGCNTLKKLPNFVGEEQVQGCWLALQTNLSMVLSKQGKHKASADVASKVLLREPNHVKALYRRAVAYRQMGNHEEARGDLRAAVKLEPNNAACKKELAAVKKDLEQSKEAQKKALAKAFSNKSSSLLYDDKEAAEKRKEEKKRLEILAKQELYKKRKQEWEDECVNRMARNESAISFDEWEKEQEEAERKKRKEEEEKRTAEEQRRKEEKQRKRREASLAKKEDSDNDDDDELTEKELAMMRGYKKTKDGRTTSYFTRELSDAEKHAYDIAPKRLHEVSNTAPTRLASVGSVTSESKGPSAWNLAGTWEEKDTSAWCTEQLRKRLEETAVSFLEESELDVNVVKVEKLEGHASVAMTGGKKRYIFEYEACLKYEIKSDDDSVVATGTLRLPDICSTHHDELEVACEPWTQLPREILESKVIKARSKFVDQVRLQVGNWVQDFNDQY